MKYFASLMLAFFASTSTAHHATVANFTREVISAEGVIEKVRFQNPHASVLIRNTAADGAETYWLIETGARTTLERKGITLDRLKVGSKDNGDRSQGSSAIHNVSSGDCVRRRQYIYARTGSR